MRILITGGAGFFGSHLASEWVARGHRVRVLDDLSTGSIENLAHLPPRSWEWFPGSSLDPVRVRRALSGCDAVFHLAARVGVKLLMEDPQRAYRENLEGARNVFAQAGACSIPVVFASSSEVYSRGFDRPLREKDARAEDIPARPRFLYGKSKLLAEHALEELAQSHSFPCRAFRFFNLIGPRQKGRYGMVVPTFLRQALSGAPLTVYGDGSQRRCFASVEEVARIVASAIPQRPGFDAVNLGSVQSISILDLARRIREEAGSASPIVFVDPQSVVGAGFEDFPSRMPCLERIEALGFDPPRQSVREMIPWLMPSRSLPLGSKSFA